MEGKKEPEFLKSELEEIFDFYLDSTEEEYELNGDTEKHERLRRSGLALQKMIKEDYPSFLLRVLNPLFEFVEHHKKRLLLVAESHRLQDENWNMPTSPKRPKNMERMRIISKKLGRKN